MPRSAALCFAATAFSLILAALALSGTAVAMPISWNNAAGGTWNAPGNWSPAQVPADTDDVTIDLAGTYTVTIDTNPTVASLALGGTTGTQTLLAVSRTVTVGGAFVVSLNGSLDFSSSRLSGAGSLTHSGASSRLLTTTVDLPIANSSMLHVQRSGTWNGAVTTGSGSTVRVESESGVASTLTVASGFTNNGTLELTNTTSTAPANLSWSGTLVNAAGATILISAGTGGSRTLTGTLSNPGTMTVNAPATLAGAGSHHVNAATGVIDVAGSDLIITQTGTTPSFTNNGAINVASGRTLTVTGGEFIHAGAAFTGAGTLSISAVTLTQSVNFVTGTLAISATTAIFNGPGAFHNSSGANTMLFNGCVVNCPLINDGTLHVQRSVTWNGAVTTSSGSSMRVESVGGVVSTLTVASGFTNNGTLELTNITSTAPANLSWSGTLVNAAGATILISPGTGGSRTLTGALSNAGTVSLNAAATLQGAGAHHVNAATGLIDVAGGSLTITQSGTTPTFTNNGAINVASGRTLTVTGGEFVHAGAAFTGAGTFSISGLTLTQSVDFVTGVLTLSVTSSTLNGPGAFHNSSGASTLLFSGCVVNSPLINDGLLHVQRSATWNGAVTTSSGSKVRVESEGGLVSTLTVASGFTNNGTLELTNIVSTAPANLSWSGTLVNAAGDTILISPGTGGSRTLTGALSNAGTVSLNAAATLQGAGAHHVNAATGLIDVAGGSLTISQTGTTPSFTNNGTLTIGAARTLTVTGGQLVNAPGATLRGNGTLNVTGTTFIEGGNINPGTSAGSLTITGPCPVDSTGAVNIELGGINPGTQYDRLTVSGALTLNAPVVISLINGFIPTPGQTFQILSFGSNVRVSVPWITGLDLGNGISLVPQVGATSVSLLAVGQTWNRLLPIGQSPPARERHAAAFNPTSDRMIVFGGLSDAGPRNDVWVLSGADGQAGIPVWTKLSPTGGPPSAREGHSAVYDPGSNTLIVFGGDDAGGTPIANAEVWVLSRADGTAGTPNWMQLTPTGGSPSARTGHGAVYDVANNRMIVFGGDEGSPCGSGLNDVWLLTNANGTGGTPVWSPLAPTGTLPSPRAHALATYDAATNRMTVIGGLVPCAASNDEMWVLADANGIGSPAWSPSSASGVPPSPWSLQSGVYDPVANRMTVFGGVVGGTPANVVRMLTDANGMGAPVWVDLTPTSDLPDPRSLHSAVQAGAHRMVVFGGAGSSKRLADVWVLEEMQGRVVSVPADSTPRSVRWVTGFSRPPAPNPTRGLTHFAIALSRAQRAQLTVTDVTGRRVALLHRGNLEAGEHAFDWRGTTDSGARAAAGLYFVSLETEELRQVRKLVLAR